MALEPDTKGRTIRWPAWLRAAVSVVLVLHFGLISLVYFSNNSLSRMPIADNALIKMQPYLVGLGWYTELLPHRSQRPDVDCLDRLGQFGRPLETSFATCRSPGEQRGRGRFRIDRSFFGPASQSPGVGDRSNSLYGPGLDGQGQRDALSSNRDSIGKRGINTGAFDRLDQDRPCDKSPGDESPNFIEQSCGWEQPWHWRFSGIRSYAWNELSWRASRMG